MSDIALGIGLITMFIGFIGLVFKKIVKKRRYGAGLIFLGFVLAVSSAAMPSAKPDNQTSSSPTSAIIEPQALRIDAATEIEKIKVTIDVQDATTQDGKQKVVVYVQNNSDYNFSGNVTVKSLDVNKATLGWDIVYPENVKPGARTYAILWLKVAPQGTFTFSTSGEFKH